VKATLKNSATNQFKEEDGLYFVDFHLGALMWQLDSC
jgi:hypothetical protein